MPEIEDPTERFISVVKFYLSGWHIKPPGVKKPLNPILGETFTCYWEFPDHAKGYYISEQTSHHPPKSSYFYMAPEHKIRIDGCLKPRSKFLGNSAASMMEGIAILRFLNRRGKDGKPESYILTQPNMYARGILFGKMKYELGDHSKVTCPTLGLSADIEFKTKGYFGGTYNAIGGSIKNDAGDILYELSGMWSGEMFITNKKTGKKELLFDARRAKHTPPIARTLEEQDERESQKLWYNTAEAVKARDHVRATDEKTKIEDMQRDEAARRVEEGIDWHPRLFRPVRGGPGGSEQGEEDLDWILNANIDGDTPEKQTAQILAVAPILRGQIRKEKNPIPPPHHRSESYISTHAPEKRQNPPTDDLIDFGQLENTPPQSHLPADLLAAQTKNNGQQQRDLEGLLKSTSTPPPPGNQGSLIDFHEDLKKGLPKTENALRRQDTDTQSLDEFVDAEE